MGVQLNELLPPTLCLEVGDFSVDMLKAPSRLRWCFFMQKIQPIGAKKRQETRLEANFLCDACRLYFLHLLNQTK
jgi:hypothetical protein